MSQIVPAALLHNRHSKPIQKTKPLSGAELYRRLGMQRCLPVVQAAAPNLSVQDIKDAEVARLLPTPAAQHLHDELGKRGDVVTPASKELVDARKQLEASESALATERALARDGSHIARFIREDASADQLAWLARIIKDTRQANRDRHVAAFAPGQLIQAQFTEGWLDAVYIKPLVKRHRVRVVSNQHVWNMPLRLLRARP